MGHLTTVQAAVSQVLASPKKANPAKESFEVDNVRFTLSEDAVVIERKYPVSHEHFFDEAENYSSQYKKFTITKYKVGGIFKYDSVREVRSKGGHPEISIDGKIITLKFTPTKNPVTLLEKILEKKTGVINSIEREAIDFVQERIKGYQSIDKGVKTYYPKRMKLLKKALQRLLKVSDL